MKYDVAVIGGGPAGMMAAGRAGELGASVILVERNAVLGAKLLVTGGGRCNITNKTDDIREFVTKFGKNGKFLFPAFYNFGPSEVIDFFENHSVKVKVEEDGRVFPKSNRARDVLDAVMEYLKAGKVEIFTGREVKEIKFTGSRIEKLVLDKGDEIYADNFVIASGGMSYPELGSRGDGYKWLKKMGHKITRLLPALTPVIVRENYIKELEGISLVNAGVKLYKDNKKIDSQTGGIVFTARGISGPVILNLSRKINEELPGQIDICIDFCPEMNPEQLNERLQFHFHQSGNMMIKNILDILLPAKLLPLIFKIAAIEPEKKGFLVTKEERLKILNLIKEFKFGIKGCMGFDKAMITAGGVELSGIEPKSMKSKMMENLYIAGEILDIEGPTGGYNLQLCWSTGVLAGESAGTP